MGAVTEPPSADSPKIVTWFWITAEGRNVALDPFEHGKLGL